MNLRKRLQVLEGRKAAAGWDDRPPVLIGRLDMAEDDVIGIGTSRNNAVPRLPGESFDDLVDRARPALATPWCGMPLILVCQYADKRVDA
jgi:hypothetical protein